MLTVKHRLYKYFSNREWAEEFLDGNLYFNSLGYFRDYEDEEVRRDKNEGTSLYHPPEGLVVNNYTKKKRVTLQGWAFRSTVKVEEVFVLCASRSRSEKMRDRFKAVVMVEIAKIGTLCERIERALPGGSTFRAGKVNYYDPTQPPDTLWALPDDIARSKVNSYRWQDEFRFLFSPTDALAFEKVITQLTSGEQQEAKSGEHKFERIRTATLRDICQLHELGSAEMVRNQLAQKAAGVS